MSLKTEVSFPYDLCCWINVKHQINKPLIYYLRKFRLSKKLMCIYTFPVPDAKIGPYE